MTIPEKTVGRLEFFLTLVPATAAGFVFELLLRRGTLTHLNSSLSSILRATIFCLVGMFSAKAINGRLLDAGLPRWCRFLALSFWLASTSLPFFLPRTIPLDLGVFLLLVIAGASIPGKHLPADPAIAERKPEGYEKASLPNPGIPLRLLVTPIGFLRSLLTFACLGLPLVWLETSSGYRMGPLIADLGYAVLSFVWAFKVLGRFADSGQASSWFWFPFCVAVTGISLLPLWYRVLNRYEALLFFLVIQLPLASLRSDPRIVRPAPVRRWGDIDTERYLQEHPNAKRFTVMRYSFLRRLAVIVCLWATLIYLQNASGNDSKTLFFVSCGYFVVGFAWVMNLSGRFTDAGLAHSWHTLQFFLVVSVASLMPLAVHWVNGYGALAIFFVIQIPIAFFPSKPTVLRRTAT